MSTPRDFAQRSEPPKAEDRPDLVGDGYDPEVLWTAAKVGSVLQLPTKSVYTLPIRRVILGPRRIRWRPSDVRSFIDGRLTDN